MRTISEIEARIENYVEMLDREECQDEATQIKLWAKIDELQWVRKGWIKEHGVCNGN